MPEYFQGIRSISVLWLSEETRKDIALAYQRGEGCLRQLAARYSTLAGTVQRCVASYRSTLTKAA
jgi:hypothetical protein